MLLIDAVDAGQLTDNMKWLLTLQLRESKCYKFRTAPACMEHVNLNIKIINTTRIYDNLVQDNGLLSYR